MPATKPQPDRRRFRRKAPGVETVAAAMGPPVSNVGWSPDLVAQTLEVLPIGASQSGLFWLKPVHAGSLKVGLPVASQPADVVLRVLGWYDLQARVVHSTSWRLEAGKVVLTYAAVVDPPQALPPDSLTVVPVERAELARGGSTGAPKDIGISAVIEHALRHLAWLLREDGVIVESLPGWKALLDGYEPEPFQALV